MNLDLPNLLPLLIIGGSFGFTGTILYGAWLLGRYRGREERTPAALANVEARLQRLEYAIGQATGTLERLEAANRQAARLLSESAGGGARPPRMTTPH